MLLKFLRKKGVVKKILWIIILGVVVAFGIAPSFLISTESKEDYAGKIFGKTIALEEFREKLQLTEIQSFLQYRENFDKLKQFLNLEGQTWDRLILLHEAEKKGIKIDDKNVIETIQRLPFFQQDGQFDPQLYTDTVQRAFRIPTRRFEEGTRDSLKIVNLYETVTAPISISDDEVFTEYQQKNQKIQLSYIFFPATEHKDKIVLDETQTKEFYEQHKDMFRLPEMVNVEYVQIDYPEKTVTDKPESETQELSDEEKDATRQKAVDIANQLATNPDFAQAAQAHQLTVDTSGFFSIEQPNLQMGWPFPLIKKVFQMTVGEISEPVETAKGYQIVRLKEKKEAQAPTYEEAQEQVKAAWIDSESKKMAKAKADQFLKPVQEKFQSVKVPDFAQIAKDLGLKIYQTPVFTQGQYLPQIGIAKEFQDKAFSLKEDSRLSDIVEVDKGYCILHLDSILPVDMAEFAKAKEEFSQTLLAERKGRAFNDYITQLRLKANLEDKIAEMRKKKEQEQTEILQ